MLAFGPQHDDAHATILVERLEGLPQLVALRHGDDVHRRSRQHDVGALARGIDLDAESVEVHEASVGAVGHVVISERASLDCEGADRSSSYSPATRRRRSSLPTGDFGTSATKT